MVAGRQSAVLVNHVDQHFGAVHGQALRGHGRLPQLLLHGPLAFQVCLRVGQRDAAGAAQGNGLEVFGAHHRAHAGPARGPVQVVHDTGKAHQVFPCRTDAGNDSVRHAKLGAQGFLGLPDRLAPQVVGSAQFHLVVIYPQVGGLGGLALQDNHVIAGELHLRSPEAAGIRGGNGVGQRALGDDHIARATRRVGAGQRPGGKDHFVLRAERIDAGVHLFVEIFDAEPATANIVSGPFGVQRLLGDAAGGQIDTQDSSGPAVHCVGRAHALPPSSSCIC